ncbi:MAG: thiamine pyrophosphate-binding protein, partial [Myxococcota bacterium]
MSEISGARIIARSLKQQGVEYMFGVVGFPVIPIAAVAEQEGIRYLGFRNEQSASYAAGAIGYLTGRPGACLAVSGPGMVHGIAGLANAWSNCWPMILLGGANDSYQDGMGAFQETPQVEAARPFSKYAARPESAKRIPFFIEKAVRTSISGRPGAVYLDLPNDLIAARLEDDEVDWLAPCPEPARSLADPACVESALETLRNAERPLVIVGKGAAYARAENEVREFLDKTQLPFLASPMGKGVVPDDHPLSVAPARSHALQNADVVFLIGARLNWIMHFGLPPRFAESVKIIQLDISPEEIGTNVPAAVPLVGDAQRVMSQLNDALDAKPWTYAKQTAWRGALDEQVAQNVASVDAMLNDDSEPMGYYRVLREIRDLAGRNAIICSEGANTMDIGRTVLPNFEPRHRLDAGTYGTMGVGLGFAIAAAVACPDKKVICVEGDSAFGFSGMEVETACRFRLPITFIIINNNGIGGGMSEYDLDNPPPFVYTLEAR